MVEYYVICLSLLCMSDAFQTKELKVGSRKGGAREEYCNRVRRSPFCHGAAAQCPAAALVCKEHRWAPSSPLFTVNQNTSLVLAVKLHEPMCGSTAPLYVYNRNGLEMDSFLG